MPTKSRRAPEDGHHAEPPTSDVAPRPPQWLVTRKNALIPAGAVPLDFAAVVDGLERDPETTIVRTLPAPDVALFRAGPDNAPHDVLVVQMPQETAERLDQHPEVLVEEDHLVQLSPGPGPAVSPASTAFLPPGGTTTTWTLRVLRGDDGSPVPGIKVYLYGSGYPAEGVTAADGTVSLSLVGETDATLRALFVDPERDCWNLWVDRPALASGATNVVRLRPLTERFPDLPGRQTLGWGQRAMRLDQLPPAFTGRGAKVAVIDSGAAAGTHPDLRGVRSGTDLTREPADEQSWVQDTVGHGSHCTGVIAGADDGHGIRGFAPEAEVRSIKIFPGGRFSDLLDALDLCIREQVDVVNMSLGSGQGSDLLLQKIAQARQQGVACIVAAGNSGDAVQFPATSPDVLTVAAVGRVGEYPDDSFHAQQEWTEQGTSRRVDGMFAAKFSCHGPEVDVCAPGVAVLSSVPADGFGTWDGTSMATPHVAGLAALLVAHHPDLTGPFAQRDGRRVARLFQLLTGSCTPLDVGDATRTGAGMPDAPRALGVAGPDGADAHAQAAEDPLRQLFAQIAQRMTAAGLDPAEPTSVGLLQLHDRLVGAGVLAP